MGRQTQAQVAQLGGGAARALRWPVVAFTAGALVVACGGGTTRATSSGASSGTTSASVSSKSGCGTSVTPGSSTLTLTVAGRRRTVIVHVPTGYDDSTRTPLVFNLHGSGSTAAAQEVFSGMDSTADAEGFIVAYPQALIPDGSGFDWNVPGEPLIGDRPVPEGAADDVSFLVDLVSVMEQRYCVDPARVYATGFSGGARMTSQLGCDASDVFAAIAPVSGLRDPDGCPATRAVPVIAFHGTADPVDPYNGHGQAYWTYSVPQAAADWGAQDGCSSTPTSYVGTGYTLNEYTGCRSGSTVELYSLIGEGHEWPGGPNMPEALTKLLGPQSSAVDADKTTWEFFSTHPMP